MKRRNFLKFLGSLVPAALIKPQAPPVVVEPQPLKYTELPKPRGLTEVSLVDYSKVSGGSAFCFFMPEWKGEQNEPSG